MRQDFNWSQLDRNNLYSMLYSAGSDIVGKKMSVKTLHQRLGTHIKSCLPVTIKKLQYDTKQDRGFPYMGGSYDSVLDHKGKKKFIEVVLSYNPLDTEAKITKYRWTRLCSLFADTILHEIIHMRQYRRRQFKSLPGYASTAEKTKQREEQSYLGDMDEIDAYSFNIACELNAKFYGKDKDIVNYLNKNQNGLRRRSNCWRMYLKAFDHNHNHPIIKKVKKRVLYYLPRAKMGKPYQTKDWISS